MVELTIQIQTRAIKDFAGTGTNNRKIARPALDNVTIATYARSFLDTDTDADIKTKVKADLTDEGIEWDTES